MTRVGIIGAGAWGRNHVRTFASLEEAELVALADSRPDVLAAHRRSLPGVEGYADGRELLAQADVEAVVIATPAPTHHALARAALESGRHVLVEKPLALATADAEDLARLADEKGLVLMVGHLLLYHAAVEYLKGLIEEGELGDLLYGYCQRLNLGVVRPDENALWSLAPHDFSVLAWLLGEQVADVSARGADYLQPGVEDVVFADLRWRNGRIAHVHVSWLDPHKIRRITLVGSRKMVVFDDMAAQEKVRVYDKGAERVPDAVGWGEHLAVRSGDILIPKVPPVEPLRNEARHFLACVREGKRPRSDGWNGVAVVRMLEAAQASLAAGGRPVPLDGAGEEQP